MLVQKEKVFGNSNNLYKTILCKKKLRVEFLIKDLKQFQDGQVEIK